MRIIGQPPICWAEGYSGAKLANPTSDSSVTVRVRRPLTMPCANDGPESAVLSDDANIVKRQMGGVRLGRAPAAEATSAAPTPLVSEG